MPFSATEKCAFCTLFDGSAECLRRQAQRCLQLARRAMRPGTHDVLNELSMDLMEEASALEKKRSLL